ncbi:hypothetical protein MKX01_021379, partial [Papaver californicum]
MRVFEVPLLSLILIILFSLLKHQHMLLKRLSYVVYLGAHSRGPEVTLSDLEKLTGSHYQLLSTILGSHEKARESIFYSYTRYINGFAAVLDTQEAEEIWIKQNSRNCQLLMLSSSSGVWPESKSFSDEGMGPIPSRWKGTCQSKTINGLIGARYFIKGYAAAVSSLNFRTNVVSARDYHGHGTHTLSTPVVTPYQVLVWAPLAAFDAAIHDGVDVISVSIGKTASDYFSDGIATCSFHAMKHGITVVAAADNIDTESVARGDSVTNVAPWVLRVGANTMDQEFPVRIALGNRKHLEGQSLYPGPLPIRKFYPLINGTAARAANSADHDAQLCFAVSLDSKKVKGKILACLWGITNRTEKGKVARQAGAIGMILVNDISTGKETVADRHVLPTAHINYQDGLILLSYINSTKSPDVFMTRARTQLGGKAAHVMAGFSCKGPNTITPEILKPDITAPGVNIIAAVTPTAAPTGETDSRGIFYSARSGTSMSCPHISGIAGLLKTLHPDWSPSAIKSAIMTT